METKYFINEKLEKDNSYYIRSIKIKNTKYFYGYKIPEEIMNLSPIYRNYAIRSLLTDLGNKLRVTAGQNPDKQDLVFKEVLSSFKPYIVSLKRDIREKSTGKPKTAEDLTKFFESLSADEKAKFLKLLNK